MRLRIFVRFDLVSLAGGSGLSMAYGFEKLHQHMHTQCVLTSSSSIKLISKESHFNIS